MPDIIKSSQPWWIWILAFFLLQIAAEISIFFLYTPGTADVYLLFAVGIVLIYWLGPRVLILVYLNTFINSYFWQHENIFSWPIFGIPETTFVFLSWFLFIKLAKGKYWLPDLNNVIKFLILGISIPLCVQVSLLKLVLIYFGELEADGIWQSIQNSWMGDFMPTVVVSMPILYYLSKIFKKWQNRSSELIDKESIQKTKYFYIELFSVSFLVVLLSQCIDFNKFWFVFGLISLIVSVRHGFGPTILINLLILITTYFIPALIFKQTSSLYFNQNELIEIYLGINLLSLFSIICGRVISDYRQAQYNIQFQMKNVEKINSELDSFVYSVSHDLIAPLKSIKGLTNLMRLDNNPDNNKSYAVKIEESATKLDQFINEILEFSRNSRIIVTNSKIDIELMIKEIISNHRYIDEFDKLNFDLSGIELKWIFVDKMRLKIILHNLISNAIKFSSGRQDATIKISSKKTDTKLEISVTDSGLGIPKKYLDKIFDMFYRASINSSGSGLGLYIAKEAANKINAEIFVESTEGIGSKFTLSLPG